MRYRIGTSAKFWLLTAAILASTCMPLVAEDAVQTQVSLPATIVPASVEEPPCNDGTPDSTGEIIKALGAAIDYFAIGAPVVSGALEIPGVTERVRGMFGLNNGEASCQIMCVVIPASATVIKEDACVTDEQGRQCNLVQGHNDIFIDYWGGVRALGGEVDDDKQLVCALGKNWSHDRDRTVSWRVWY